MTVADDEDIIIIEDPLKACEAELKELHRLRNRAKRGGKFTAITQLAAEIRRTRELYDDLKATQSESGAIEDPLTADEIILVLVANLGALPTHMLVEVCNLLREDGHGFVLDGNVATLGVAEA